MSNDKNKTSVPDEAKLLAEQAAAKAAEEAAAAEAAKAAEEAAPVDTSLDELQAMTLTPGTVRFLAEHITLHNYEGLRASLLAELTTTYDAQIAPPDDDGMVWVDIGGLRTDPCANITEALTNWANAARRLTLGEKAA